ncbi:hypothetical protein ACGFS9_11240 [Streptomyces sp. NPDC048566]|uniref:hypothetical protein n=1 Tax=Streptomyces sp. NPDC048566 TaxID=3365569 RepID=UPI00371CCDD2
MSDDLPRAPGETPHPIPRDLPDQQARDGDDPWEVVSGEGGPATDVPAADEAGSARRGAAGEDSAPSADPGPQESTD